MFDNLCKFLVENFPNDFASWLLGEPVTLTELSPKELSLEPIRADALILRQSSELILHAEFQTQPDVKIPFRMADYRLRGYRRFPQKRMRQVVIYLRKTNSEEVYKTTFELEETLHRFQVIRLWEQPTEIFLRTPGLLPFAVLSNAESKIETLQEVATRIENISDKQIQTDVAASTFILAGLVLKQEDIQRLLRRDIMRESVTYQLLVDEGKAEGKAEGRAEGKAQGSQETARTIAVNLLKEGLAIDLIAKTTGLTVEQVQQLQSEQSE
ncbi:Rpn family recombination-promoting nuclease/putative transposase [Rivularia sp. UHCC 0363]|uniref:Rpn family recombination-promoting nuclease/putative transposase n=1 Tax=Rivularia sp. UHCC 0363 TaxID=3110244 RepID=UPI002B20F895|nr:Rpn family recombination-promoting nuclease/putative transposase [Rivularia sp. UHCC 0363]MEA5597678.1 Rpn family recombination-promoting nuclease/putative transposase [Rivularia sp. UHCC 0363]